MLIKLADIETQSALEEVQKHPAEQEDCVLYVTGKTDMARELIRLGVPCIFLEHEEGSIYGAAMVIRCQEEETWNWRADGEFLERIWRRHYQLPWIIAETERLVIRESVPEDLEEFLELYGQEAGNRDVKPFSEEAEEELKAYICSRYGFYGYGLWTVTERMKEAPDGDGKRHKETVVGRIGFEEWQESDGGDGLSETADGAALELQYLIGRKYRNRGYAKEACQALLTYAGEELAVERVILRTSRENMASRNLAEKLGFSCFEQGKNNNRIIYYSLKL